MKRRAILTSMVVLGGCANVCENEVIRRVESPSGDVAAVLFQRDCGATTGFSSQVSVVNAEGEVSGSGNAFVADTDGGMAKQASWGGPLVELEWRSVEELVLQYDARARVFKRENAVSGVRVTYGTVR